MIKKHGKSNTHTNNNTKFMKFPYTNRLNKYVTLYIVQYIMSAHGEGDTQIY